jgi:hypothetical protein
MSSLIRRVLVCLSAIALGAAGALVVAGPASAAGTLAATGSTGLPAWVPIVGAVVLLLGIGAVVFSVLNRRSRGGAADAATTNPEPTTEPGTSEDPKA